MSSCLASAYVAIQQAGDSPKITIARHNIRRRTRVTMMAISTFQWATTVHKVVGQRNWYLQGDQCQWRPSTTRAAAMMIILNRMAMFARPALATRSLPKQRSATTECSRRQAACKWKLRVWMQNAGLLVKRPLRSKDHWQRLSPSRVTVTCAPHPTPAQGVLEVFRRISDLVANKQGDHRLTNELSGGQPSA